MAGAFNWTPLRFAAQRDAWGRVSERDETIAITAVPVLTTERLLLRPYTLADAPAVQAMAGDWRVAEMTLNIPHPYPDGLAEDWIGGQAQNAAEGRSYTFAIEAREDQRLLGAISIMIESRHRRAEIGYWLGQEHWRKGYMSEAARRIVAFGFTDLGLNRIQATCLPGNLGSSGVMRNAGMRSEGLLREYTWRKGQYDDIEMYAIIRSDWLPDKQ